MSTAEPPVALSPLQPDVRESSTWRCSSMSMDTTMSCPSMASTFSCVPLGMIWPVWPYSCSM